MDSDGESKSCLHLKGGDSFYPMLFGIACGLFACEGLSKNEFIDEKWLDIRAKMLQGSVHMLGLLIWKVQRHEVDVFKKCELLEEEVRELKKRRIEDARANEKVVSIYASHEQGWFSERRNLRRHIDALGKRKHEEISELKEKLQEMELSLRYKNDILEEEGKKMKDFEERIKNLETLVEEQRETAECEAREHIEQLEAELSSALRQAETAKEQLDFVFEEKEEIVSIKDTILSTLLRKSKLETEEKRKLSKVRMVSEPKSERQTLRSILAKKVSSRLGAKSRNNDYDRGLEEVETESETYSFSGQIRLKDEKLEKYHFRLLRTEVESKRLSSQIESVNDSILQLGDDKLKLENLLVEREMELKLLRDQIAKHLNSLTKQRYKVESSKKKPIENEQKAEKSEVEVKQQVLYEKEPQREVSSSTECLIKDGLLLKMDIHALGVSYKIKRLKQLLVMLEKVTGKQGGEDSVENEVQDKMGIEGFMTLLSLLNKEATRYHTLQLKADDLCKRMHEKDMNANQGQSSPIRTKEASKTLENFLDETFQLQRLIVASGQKQIEIQSKIGCGFSAMAEKLEGSTSTCSFDTRRFSESIQSLFQEVQRGLEVRIARIIGEIEGTLAWNVIHSRQK